MRECKLLHIRYNVFAQTEMLSLSVYESITKEILHGEPSPNLGEDVELGGQVWHPAKLLRNRYNLFAGTETLSLSVNEPIAKQILVGGPSPNLGEGVELGV